MHSWQILAIVAVLAFRLTIGLANTGPGARDEASQRHVVEFARGASAHVVAEPDSSLENRLLGRLTTYLEQVLGKPATIVRTLDEVPSGMPAIVLSNRNIDSPIPLNVPDESKESFALITGRTGERVIVVTAGHTDKGRKRAVQRLILKSQQRTHTLVIPELDIRQSPWILHREWAMCPWDPQFVRGMFHHPYTDKRLNIYLYSNQRLADYVEMFDWFGFSGCQLMETCYTYSVLGSVDATHQWQKTIARFLRDNGQEVSLWAWAAEFSGYGWLDPEVTYSPQPGKTAYEDPKIRRAFEKYYDQYAELAPYVDRFFGHFYDPGHLKDRNEVYNYMRLLEAKLKAKSPRIQMGIDCWAGGTDYLPDLVDNGFQDYLLLLLSLPESYPSDTREDLHRDARKLGLTLGIWGWYTTEYETDQLASMYVNAQVLKNVYDEIRHGALEIHPVEYWSEMEAHHLNNISSMYTAGQLLWDPEREPDEILEELTSAIWGSRNGPVVLRALELIQDVRSGPTWETYWWRRPTHRVGTEEPADDLRRANEALAALESMQTDPSYVPKFPLPYPPATFVELMLPHLRQIKHYAEFRLKVADIRKAADNGASKDTLTRMLSDAWQPVPEYDTWVGTFGGKELREQKKIINELKREYQLEIRDPDWLRHLEANRALQVFRSQQLMLTEPLVFEPAHINRQFFWPKINAMDRFEKLIADHVVESAGNDQYRLAEWQNWAGR